MSRIRSGTACAVLVCTSIGNSAAFQPSHAFPALVGTPRRSRKLSGPLAETIDYLQNLQSCEHHRCLHSNPTVLRSGFALNDDGAEGRRDQQSSSTVLGAVAIDTFTRSPRTATWDETNAILLPQKKGKAGMGEMLRGLRGVLSTSLLITGNTIGAGTLILPETAAKPGLAVSTGMFLASYLVNLLSGMVLAEVAIKQHEAYGEEVPSSFKDFAEANLKSPLAATVIASISLFVNMCVLGFDLTRAGHIGSSLLAGITELGGASVDPSMLSIVCGAVMASLCATQSAATLSEFASAAVGVLVCSFLVVLVPGLANVQDSMANVIGIPGTAPEFWSGITEAAPIILTTMIFQNIVPSVTKILNYNRLQTTAAVALGSFVPLLIYWAWCFAVIGGGIDTTVGFSAPIMTVFSLAAVTGSTLGSIMSVSEELDSLLPPLFPFAAPDQRNEAQASNGLASSDEVQTYSLSSVLTAVSIPLFAAHIFSNGEDFTSALKVAGSYGSPLLYGIIPMCMAWTQRQRHQEEAGELGQGAGLDNLVPGGTASLGLLGAAFGGYMMNELLQDVGSLLS